MRQIIELIINDIPFVANHNIVIGLILFSVIGLPILSYLGYLIFTLLKVDK